MSPEPKPPPSPAPRKQQEARMLTLRVKVAGMSHTRATAPKAQAQAAGSTPALQPNVLTVADLPAEWHTAGDAPRGKYGNRKTVVDGIAFDSAREAARYQELQLLQSGLFITNLRCHTPWPLQVNGVKVGIYESDFDYTDLADRGDGKVHIVVEDVKGVRTAVYRLKKKLMLACWGIAIKEVR